MFDLGRTIEKETRLPRNVVVIWNVWFQTESMIDSVGNQTFDYKSSAYGAIVGGRVFKILKVQCKI